MAEDISNEELADSKALMRFVKDEYAWPAFQRLVKSMRDDLMERFMADEAMDRASVRAGRDVLDQIAENIKSKSELAQAHEETLKDASKVIRSASEDGMGSGDLAI